MGLMPILPSHLVTEATFARTSLEPPVGSGPYVVAKVDAGRALILKRNPAHWAAGKPIARGRFNFDEIRTEYFRDTSSLFEAFKAGEIDVRFEDDPVRWAEGYGFAAVKAGRVDKREIPLAVPAGMSALVMNARRPPFDNPAVRRALIQAFDAEWINRSLFNGLYRRTDSFFARSELASTHRPADARERALLVPFPGAVREDVMEGRAFLPVTDATGSDRKGLREASRILTSAGYELRGGRMVEARTGRALAFELMASSRTQERLMIAFAEPLKRLGITARIRQVDSAQYWARMRTFDFDMMQWNWGASLSPGNEQINRWSSAAAAIEGSLNYAGVRNPAADAVIDRLVSAETREDLVSATRALDRVLLSGDYVIPLFHAPGQWMAAWTRIKRPSQPSPAGIAVDTWWMQP